MHCTLDNLWEDPGHPGRQLRHSNRLTERELPDGRGLGTDGLCIPAEAGSTSTIGYIQVQRTGGPAWGEAALGAAGGIAKPGGFSDPPRPYHHGGVGIPRRVAFVRLVGIPRESLAPGMTGLAVVPLPSAPVGHRSAP